ncbi:hypothetical protein KJ671_00675 [Patescibacteria group bacterium]|nr:hypothetical protein [Patescibacteria group bacterium]
MSEKKSCDNEKCRVCGKDKMLTAEGVCVYCSYPPGYPLHKDWKKLQKELLPKQREKDRKLKKWARNWKKSLSRKRT